MVAAHAAILPAPLYRVEVTTEMRMELQWWTEESCHHNGRPLGINQWDVTIESDASKMGWGAFSPLEVDRPGESTQHQLSQITGSLFSLEVFCDSQRSVSPVTVG